MNITKLGNALRMGLLLFLTITGFDICAQCPSITIREKYDHIPAPHVRAQGWDTISSCLNRTLVLHADTFITTQHFNGTYLVESIPYNPVDTTFHAGQRLQISTDDAWENATISFPFDFVFFGYTYDKAVVGSNGIVSFNSGSVKTGTTAPIGLTNVAGQHCEYSYNTPIPTTNFVSGISSHNAIYGVYEDIDPAYLQNPTTCGMFRSIGGTYPCRYLCASVNGVDLFGNHNNYNTYQIVCYEGTNIIEVHVKKRNCCSSTNGGKGIIGIQNSTGDIQESHYHQGQYINDPSFYINPNSPGAFTAPNRNGWTGETQYEAWRFIPQGETTSNISWWRIFKDAAGNIVDSVELTNNPTDTNGYYMNALHTEVSITPSVTSYYVTKCIYRGANGYVYGIDKNSMRDTITVGVDTAKAMRILQTPALTHDDILICEGEQASVVLDYDHSRQTLDGGCTWQAMKVYHGARTPLQASYMRINGTSFTLLNQTNNLHTNHIDTVMMYCTATFSNGCNNSDSIMVRTYPKFTFYDTAGICDGQSYTGWCNKTLSEPGDYEQKYLSQPKCDSTYHLHLVVSHTSSSTKSVVDCRPYTWKRDSVEFGNGKTYTKSNTETMALDTVVLKNKYQCDSIVTLDFTLVPVTAIIHHDPEAATLDNLNITLNDMSVNSSGRTWYLDGVMHSNDSSTSVAFPMSGVDSIIVKLAANSLYGNCTDTAKQVVRLHKNAVYAPNIFTPDRPENNQFRPYIVGNITEVQCWIYDRHGELIRYFITPEECWDGTTANGVRCPQGTYVYVLRYRSSLEPDVTTEVPGTITLIR